jgi:pyrroline-5-carboxylate reductase
VSGGQTVIGFIGGGNMAVALAGGLLRGGHAPTALCVSEPDAGRRAALREATGIEAVADNASVATAANVLVLAVKPQVMEGVCLSLAPVIAARRPLVVSIAAGIPLHALARWLGEDLPIVRTMPNTPALTGAGVTGLFANARTSRVQRAQAEGVLRAVGQTLWLDAEAQLDAVTALSGSGPAYFFLVIEALEEAGVALGLPAPLARQLAVQTAHGAGLMAAAEGAVPPAELRRRVTSPGGTTERALAVLEAAGLRDAFVQAVQAASTRSRELSIQMGGAA